jgi:arylsulfatase A-like enzyme
MKQNSNILLIVMDAVRADHLSCYGYKRPTTPFLEEMAADGVIFDNAFAAAPWTSPSHASLFATGRRRFRTTIPKVISIKNGLAPTAMKSTLR